MWRIILFLLYGTTLVAQSIVVIQNNQQVRSGAINDSIRDREQQYWTERVGFRITRSNDYELYAVLRGLGVAARNNNPTQLDSETLTQIGLDSLNYYADPSALPKAAGQDTATNALVSAASIDNPWVGVASGPVLDMMSANLANQISNLYPIDRDELRSRFIGEGSDGLKALWAEADKDPRLKAAINAVIAKRYKGISLSDNPVTSPDVDLQTYKSAVQALENPNLSPQELQAAFKVFTESQNKKLDALDKELRRFVAAKSTEQQKENELKNFRASIDDERAVFYLASSFAGIVDPTTGRVISGIGTAYTKIAEASGLYRLGQISSLRLTADVVSAGLLLTSMLGNSGPTADEMILEEIHKLSLQIDSFRQEMHQRFDRVDQSLSRMYIDLIANFNEVNKNVARARQGIVALQVQLVNLQGELGELDRRVQSYSQGLSSQVDSKDQLLCVPDSEGSFDYHLTSDQLLACELSFTNSGSSTSKSAVWNNLSTAYSEDTLQAELDRPIEQNLNFLWGIAAAQFNLRPSPSFTVANPVVWAGNSTKYVRLLSSSRPISTRVEATDELIRTGNEINAAIKALGQSGIERTNETLFDRVVPYFIYQLKKTDLDVAALEAAYQRQMMGGYDPWAGTEQQKDSSTPESRTFTTAPHGTPLEFVPSLEACPDAKDLLKGAQLAAPKNLASWIPYTFRMAQELGLGHVNACYSTVHWGAIGQNGDVWIGSLVLEVRLTFSLNPVPQTRKKASKVKADPKAIVAAPIEMIIGSRTAKSADWSFDCGTERTGGSFGGVSVVACNRRHQSGGFSQQETATALQQLWPNWQDKFVGSASGEMNAIADIKSSLESVRSKVEASLGNHRAALRTEVINTIKGQTGNLDFVAEEKTGVIKDFSVIQGIKPLIDAYAGLTLSHSIEIDESLASALGGISPGNWIVEISRTGKKMTQIPPITTNQPASRVLFPLGLTARGNHLQAILDQHLRSGPEPYVLVETTLLNLKAMRVMQTAQSLSSTHPCFAGGGSFVIERGPDSDGSKISDYADADPLTAIRVSVVPANSNATSATKTDVVIGNGELLMSGLAGGQSPSNSTDGGRKISITFPANGMVFGELRTGVVRVCNDFPVDARAWSAESILVEVSKGGGTFETFRLWKNVFFPPGKLSSVTFRGDYAPSGHSLTNAGSEH